MRKPKYPEELENLTPDQIKIVHDWLDEFSYRVTKEKLLAELKIKISTTKLLRYNQHRELADELSDEEHFQIDMKEFYDLLAGNPTPIPTAGLLLINKRAFQLLLDPKREFSVGALQTLQRIFTYEKQVELAQRRLAISEERAGIEPPAKPAPAPKPKSAQPTAQPKPTPPEGLSIPDPMEKFITPRPNRPVSKE